MVKTLFDSVGPNPWVVRLAFEAKGVKLFTDEQIERGEEQGRDSDGLPWARRRNLRIVDKIPENRHFTMLEKNPAGTTPFVELDGGMILSESVAIVQYLDSLYPEHGPSLAGSRGGALEQAKIAMWQNRIALQITAPFQRQYQNGEGLPYFKQHVPWAEESAPGVPGLRRQVVESLIWLENTMQNEKTEFIASNEHFTIPDLQLYCTTHFMSSPKVNRAKLTESFDPRDQFGPWLQDWYGRMSEVCSELESAAAP